MSVSLTAVILQQNRATRQLNRQIIECRDTLTKSSNHYYTTADEMLHRSFYFPLVCRDHVGPIVPPNILERMAVDLSCEMVPVKYDIRVVAIEGCPYEYVEIWLHAVCMLARWSPWNLITTQSGGHHRLPIWACQNLAACMRVQEHETCKEPARGYIPFIVNWFVEADNSIIAHVQNGNQ